MSLAQRLRAMLGTESVPAETGAGTPWVVPADENECALVLRTASAEGWRVRVEGGAGWMPADAPADVRLSTARLTRVENLSPADLVASVGGGIRLTDLRRTLGDAGTWMPLDPPGSDRTLGSVIATATAGPLRSAFGGVRDHLLGLTLVMGDGRILRIGGRVVKNVAGYDLTRLACGSYGAFGVIAAAHVRLRAVPRADTTLTLQGVRDDLVRLARAVLDAGETPAALEVLSPLAAGESGWTLAIRLAGTDAEVAAQREAVRREAPELTERFGADGAAFWHGTASRALTGAVTLRLGALPNALDGTLDLLTHHLDEDGERWIATTVTAGTVRWSGEAPADRIALLRHAAAQQEIPLTLERAPWPIRRSLGHFGAYREGTARLVAGLRRTFDPAGIFVAPVGEDA